ncbi:hypothetical protein [Gynurincola endophyticus]|jgi:hypothetical protein|uniref:hypothetical protein n=1 Tax=Gynurincola endophyticus TaxID=2479004 RepID=UPI000F8D0AF2|nr:hypothetical protein [Gynurincola endophyticus]
MKLKRLQYFSEHIALHDYKEKNIPSDNLSDGTSPLAGYFNDFTCIHLFITSSGVKKSPGYLKKTWLYSGYTSIYLTQIYLLFKYTFG